MRRCARILLNAATVLSLVLCVVTVALWVRSYWRTDWIDIRTPGEAERPGDHGPISLTFGVVSSRGALGLTRREDETRVRPYEPYPPPPALGISVHHSPGPWQVERERWGRRWEGYAGFFGGTESYRGTGATSELRYFALPYWCPVLALILLASPVLTRLRRREHPGLCPSCGYDLRATPDRCPECGAIPAHP